MGTNTLELKTIFLGSPLPAPYMWEEMGSGWALLTYPTHTHPYEAQSE